MDIRDYNRDIAINLTIEKWLLRILLIGWKIFSFLFGFGPRNQESLIKHPRTEDIYRYGRSPDIYMGAIR